MACLILACLALAAVLAYCLDHREPPRDERMDSDDWYGKP